MEAVLASSLARAGIPDVDQQSSGGRVETEKGVDGVTCAMTKKLLFFRRNSGIDPNREEKSDLRLLRERVGAE